MKKTMLVLQIILFSAVCCIAAADQAPINAPGSSTVLPTMWLSQYNAADSDYYAALRGTFDLAEDTEVEIRLLGASWFNLTFTRITFHSLA